MSTKFDWDAYEPVESSFDWSRFEEVSPSNQNLIGKEGKLVGGTAGSILETNIEEPSQFFKEIPVAVTKFLESPITGPKALASLMSSILGQPTAPPERETFLSHFVPPEKTKIASEILGEYLREDLPEHLREGAEATSDLQAMLLPFLKNIKIPTRGSRAIPPSSTPPPASDGIPPKFEFPSFKETKAQAKDIGSKLKERLFGPDISEEIPKSLSAERFRNTTKGGMELEKAVGSTYQDMSQATKKAYAKSRAANKNIEAIHPELEASLTESLVELEKIPDPSAPLLRFINSTKKLLRDISERSPSGELVGYKPISNQVLIDQIQEYGQIPKFDFPTDSKTGIFKTLIKRLTEAVDSTAKNHPVANRAWKKAKALNTEKENLFQDVDVYKWTKLAEKNYSKDFLSSIDIDKVRKLTPVLDKTQEGRLVLQKMKRELVEKTLEDFFPVGKRFEKKEISRALAELEPVLTEEELKGVEKLFEEAQTPGAKAASLSNKFYRLFKRPVSTSLKEVSNL